MPAYVFTSSLSYSDYLQEKSFHDALVSAISSAGRNIVASNEEVGRHVEATARTLSAGILFLSLRRVRSIITAWSAGIDDVHPPTRGLAALPLTKTSTDTALRDISDLVARGILIRDGAGGRSTSYSLAQLD